MNTLSGRWLWGHALLSIGTLHRGCDNEWVLDIKGLFSLIVCLIVKVVAMEHSVFDL